MNSYKRIKYKNRLATHLCLLPNGKGVGEVFRRNVTISITFVLVRIHLFTRRHKDTKKGVMKAFWFCFASFVIFV
jgi:hypothetical protein